MTLQEILKAKGLSDEDIESVISEMKQNKIFTAAEENLDIRYGKLKSEHDTLTQQYSQANALIDQLKKGTKADEELQGKITSYETQVQSLQEQTDLRAKIEMLENEIQNQENHVESVDTFIRLAKKHLYLEKLTPEVLNDMVKAVYVHAPYKSSGHRVQDVTISYNYIGILPANLLYDVMNGKAACLLMPLPESNILFYWTAPDVRPFLFLSAPLHSSLTCEPAFQ